jgi:hypothetical protein
MTDIVVLDIYNKRDYLKAVETVKLICKVKRTTACC